MTSWETCPKRHGQAAHLLDCPPDVTDQPIAQPIYALEVGESMSKQLRVCRALKVLHGHGIHWHPVGEHVVYFTPGDMCGCIDCATRLAHTITRAHQ